MDSISSSPEDVHSDVMLAPGRLTVSCGARRPRAACGGPRRDLPHHLDPRAARSCRRPSFRPLAPAAPSWPRRCSPEPSHCRLVTAPGDGVGVTASPPLQRLRMAAAVARGVGLPWSARRHGGAGFGLAITLPLDIFKRRRNRGTVRGPALQQVGP